MQGILFIEGLYKLSSDGIKTETRRTGAFDKVINHCPDNWNLKDDGLITDKVILINKQTGCEVVVKPRYKLGEVVFLKEPYLPTQIQNVCTYKFDQKIGGVVRETKEWKNKLFMPVRYARLFIKITSVSCERLQNISRNEAAALREGIIKLPDINNKFQGYVHCLNTITQTFSSASQAYKDLFIKINKKSGEKSWFNNDWVFVYQYEITCKPENL